MLAHLKRQPTCLGATNGTKQKLKMSRSLQSPAAITDGKNPSLNVLHTNLVEGPGLSNIARIANAVQCHN